MSRHRNAPNIRSVVTLLVLCVVAAGIDLGCANAFRRDNYAPNDASTSGPSFSVRQDQGRWRLFSPRNQPFFSLGVCGVNPGIPRAQYDPENPSYSAWQYYNEPRQWADATLGRLKSWGFTTAGAWSDFETLSKSPEQTLWLTPTLQMGASSGMPWWDMWDEQNIQKHGCRRPRTDSSSARQPAPSGLLQRQRTGLVECDPLEDNSGAALHQRATPAPHPTSSRHLSKQLEQARFRL